MSIGESIGKGFGIAKKSWGLIFILFVFGFIFNVLNIFLVPQTPDANQLPSPALIATMVVFIFLSIFFQSGSMAYVRDAVKGQAVGLGNFMAGGSKYYLRILLLGLVVSLIVGVFVVLAALSAAFLQDKTFISVPLMILFAALGISFAILLFLSPYGIIADDKGVGAAIKLSMKLVKKNIGALLGISGIMILIGFGIGLLLGGILAGISFGIKDERTTQIVFSFLSSFVNSFLGVFVTGAFMNFYLGLPDRNNNT